MSKLYKFEDFVNENQYDYTKDKRTMFEFDPYDYQNDNITIEKGNDYRWNSIVGHNYKFINKNNPLIKLKVFKFIEGKLPNNYYADISIGTRKNYTKEKREQVLQKLAQDINPKFKFSGAISNFKKDSYDIYSYSYFEFSKEELQDIIKKFIKITNKPLDI